MWQDVDEGTEGKITMGHRKTFGSGGYDNILIVVVVQGVYIQAKLIKLYTLYAVYRMTIITQLFPKMFIIQKQGSVTQ